MRSHSMKLSGSEFSFSGGPHLIFNVRRKNVTGAWKASGRRLRRSFRKRRQSQPVDVIGNHAFAARPGGSKFPRIPFFANEDWTGCSACHSVQLFLTAHKMRTRRTRNQN
jgi:hypothetical protein